MRIYLHKNIIELLLEIYIYCNIVVMFDLYNKVDDLSILSGICWEVGLEQ